MKLTSLVCTSVLALGALALVADGALAATTISSSKSNADNRIDPGDANGAKACTDKGGKVYTAANGDKFCVMPGTNATTINTTKSNTFGTTSITETECTAKGGKVLTDSAGGKICLIETQPVPTGKPPRPPGG